MYRLISLSFVFLLLNACAMVQPMPPQSAQEMKGGKTAVAFYDGAKRINYFEDKYFVLGIAKVASYSAYQGLWDSDKYISALHATELSKIGVHANSLYDGLSGDEESALVGMEKDMYNVVSKVQNQDTPVQFSSALKPDFRQHLLKLGYDNLVWMTWAGYTLHIHTLGLPPSERIDTEYWIQDLKSNKTLWHGSIPVREIINFKEETGKLFLEQNNLAGLKREVTKLVQDSYKKRTAGGNQKESAGQIIGLEPKSQPK